MRHSEHPTGVADGEAVVHQRRRRRRIAGRVLGSLGQALATAKLIHGELGPGRQPGSDVDVEGLLSDVEHEGDCFTDHGLGLVQPAGLGMHAAQLSTEMAHQLPLRSQTTL